MTLGEKLRRYRESAGLSQRAFAKRLGCVQGMVAALESDTKGPAVDLAFAIEKETKGLIRAKDYAALATKKKLQRAGAEREGSRA